MWLDLKRHSSEGINMSLWPQRFAASGYLTVLLLPAVLLIGVAIGEPLLAFGTVILVFPLARVVLGTFRRPAMWREGLATALHALPLIFALVFAGVLAGLMVLLAKRPLASPVDGLSLVLSMGITFLFATCPAHELIHSRNKLTARVGRWLSGMVGYPWLAVEHLKHHVRSNETALAESPRVDESVWQFAARRIAYIAGVVVPFGPAGASNWSRLRVTSSVKEPMVIFVLTAAGFTLAAGWAGLTVYLCAAAVVTLGMQITTYLQHWGLGNEGHSDPEQRQHGWEDDCKFQAWVTMHISFHESHHLKPQLPFYRVPLAADSPRLPAGYVVLLFVCCFPNLWRRLMTPALTRWQEQPSSPLSPGRALTCFHAYAAGSNRGK
jgi:fatty acid desaturase